MPKSITIRELNELLNSQEEEIRAEYVDKQKLLIEENERLSVLLAEKFKIIDDLTERLEKTKTAVKDRLPAPTIVGVLDCSPKTEIQRVMKEWTEKKALEQELPRDISGDEQFSREWMDQRGIEKFVIPCLGDDDKVCLSCGS